jgi:hypothetical protein
MIKALDAVLDAVCLQENSFFLSEFQKSELFSDVW